MWYFTLIITDSSEEGVISNETHGPFYKKFLADTVLAARQSELTDLYAARTIKSVVSIMVVPSAEAVELAAIPTGGIVI